jgi:Phasin protein
MKKIRRAVRDGRRLQRAARATTRAVLKGAALTQATGDVMAKRTALGLSAMANPAQADHAEFVRIVPEKMAAFSASAITLMRCSQEIAQQAARFATSEMANATAAAADLARCRTPAAAVAVQGRFATAWLFRALSQSIAVGALAMRSYGDVMTPVHQVAVGNSRRLT